MRVDVIVADEEGRFVDKLTARDFRLFEDQRLQEILDVQLIDIRRNSPLIHENLL